MNSYFLISYVPSSLIFQNNIITFASDRQPQMKILSIIKMRIFYYQLYFALFVFDYAFSELDSPSIRVEQGLLAGTTIRSFIGYSVNVFLGVPYAEPPLKGLRFKVSDLVSKETPIILFRLIGLKISE